MNMQAVKFKELVFIMLGFCLGQGSMFFAQTYLIYQGDIGLVGQAGITIGLFSLIYWFSDFGGVYLLSKYLSDNSNRFNYYLCVRLVSNFFLCLLMVVVGGSVEYLESYSFLFYLGGIVFLSGSCNFAGVFDYKKKNKFAGLLQAIPWVLASVFLVFSGNPIEYMCLGYVLGVVLISFVQVLLCRKYIVGLLDSKGLSSGTYFKKVIGEMYSYNLSFLVTQLFGRVVPIFVQASMGQAVAGTYIYAKNIINMMSQFVAFARRADFSSMYELDKAKFCVVELIFNQRLSFIVGFLGFSLLLLLSLILILIDFGYRDIIITLVYLDFVFLFYLVSSVFSQYMIVADMSFARGVVQTVFLLLGMIVIYFFVEDYGLEVIYFVEAALYVMSGLVFWLLLIRERKEGI
ncbi:hypothetical protein ACMXYX_03355 [Neptuniibacter sp. QD72_48]|uniref:hypothetical protein n=1 Tax=Neptuniibacter sp. QD72_48 TaxID=3398214 RepID=UPI0039F63F73